MPFISEELWHDELFGVRGEMECCIVADYPRSASYDTQKIKDFELFQQTVSEIRNLRNTKQISPKTTLEMTAKDTVDQAWLLRFTDALVRLANVSGLVSSSDQLSGSTSILIDKFEFFVHTAEQIDVEAEKARLEKEIHYLLGFLKSVEAKLNNERFVQNAKPEIVTNERNKKADAEEKLSILQNSLKSLLQ